MKRSPKKKTKRDSKKSAVAPRPRSQRKGFDPDMLDRGVIAIPLLRQIEEEVEQIAWVKKTGRNCSRNLTARSFTHPIFPAA